MHTLLLLVSAVSAAEVATLEIPVPDDFPAIARDVLAVAVALDPSVAGNAGMFDQPVAVPSFAPRAVKRHVKRLDRDLAALRALPWRTWDVDDQIDVRLVAALAETLRHQLVVERMYERRPAQWLEPVANQLIALAGYAPERPLDPWLDAIPAMLAEMRAVVQNPTRRDVDTGIALAEALAGMAGDHPAAMELRFYADELRSLRPADEFRVIGADAYTWRYAHTLLLPWTPDELLALAERELARVDARLAELGPLPELAITDTHRAAGASLDAAGQLALYDAVETRLREATIRGGWVTIPPTVGPVRARETPAGLIPLTGDGGSMNPPPTFGTSDVGWWNVEHFRPEDPLEVRAAKVATAEGYATNRLGPYAAHEGFPGHHLQLSLARLHPDPLRSVLQDGPMIEGWGLYAEQALYEHGGLASEAAVLRSYRHRIARVVYDVKVETGVWTLDQAAAFKKSEVDEDILRSIQWPAQLVCYFAGKQQILALRDEVRANQGAAFDERAFHDAVLAEGSIPIALIRAKMLGEPVPGF